ncbi:large membrane associated protein, partial [Clavibacter phaseoli]
PDRDAPTVAVPAASPRPAPVPPPYAAPPAPRVPAPPAAAPPRGPRGPRRTGLWVGGAILLVLLLVGLFYLGQRLGSGPAPDAAPVATATAEATPTPSPTPTDPVQGPAAAGVQAWDALLGGECIDPYATPWEEEFTVVDCGSEHHAQMVARVALPQTGDEFPGEEAVRDSADELCIADTVIDYAAARAYDDVQYQSAYPITQDEWTAGNRDVYCFVSRAGGGTFTGSIGVPQPPVVP